MIRNFKFEVTFEKVERKNGLYIILVYVYKNLTPFLDQTLQTTGWDDKQKVKQCKPSNLSFAFNYVKNCRYRGRHLVVVGHLENLTTRNEKSKKHKEIKI